MSKDRGDSEDLAEIWLLAYNPWMGAWVLRQRLSESWRSCFYVISIICLRPPDVYNISAEGCHGACTGIGPERVRQHHRQWTALETLPTVLSEPPTRKKVDGLSWTVLLTCLELRQGWWQLSLAGLTGWPRLSSFCKSHCLSSPQSLSQWSLHMISNTIAGLLMLSWVPEKKKEKLLGPLKDQICHFYHILWVKISHKINLDSAWNGKYTGCEYQKAQFIGG